MFTATLNGTLGHTSSSYARKVIATIATASPELKDEFYKKLFFRKSALDGTANTNLPVVTTLPLAMPIKFFAMRSVNSATVILHSQEGSGPTNIYHTVLLGATDHPEGLYIVFGSWNLIDISVTAVGADNTEVEIWAGY